jgi:hypothetical protein
MQGHGSDELLTKGTQHSWAGKGLFAESHLKPSRHTCAVGPYGSSERRFSTTKKSEGATADTTGWTPPPPSPPMPTQPTTTTTTRAANTNTRQPPDATNRPHTTTTAQTKRHTHKEREVEPDPAATLNPDPAAAHRSGRRTPKRHRGRAAGRSAGEEAAGRRVGEGTAGRRAGKEPQPPRGRKEPPPHQGKEPSCLLMCHRRTSPRCCSSPHVRGEPRGGDKWCNMCIWFFLFFKIPIVFFLGGKQQRKLINLSVPNTFLNLAI